MPDDPSVSVDHHSRVVVSDTRPSQCLERPVHILQATQIPGRHRHKSHHISNLTLCQDNDVLCAKPFMFKVHFLCTLLFPPAGMSSLHSDDKTLCRLHILYIQRLRFIGFALYLISTTVSLICDSCLPQTHVLLCIVPDSGFSLNVYVLTA